MPKTKNTFHLVSLGCSKNTVDSDSMAQLLIRDGYRAVKKPERASVLIVNTCGFIGSARDESLRELQKLADGKRDGQLLIAAGCLTQRYGADVARQVPGVDGILGTRRWMDILQVVRELRKTKHPEPLYHLPESATVGTDEAGTVRTSPSTVLRASLFGSAAYLKIADGCRRPCAFCAIPLIKGTLVSRPLETILNEARRLRDMGVRELILIAQDTTDYGHDLGMKDGLAILLENLSTSVPDLDWIRVMYAYPGYVTDRLIDVMASSKQVLHYLDMPLQHAHPKTLYRMKRPSNMEWVHKTLEKMRAAMPQIAIRTTFIVGYPGETEEEFRALEDFVREIRFDRAGAFPFSFEPGTTSEPLGDPVPPEVKQERYERLMELQQNISLQVNQSYVGKTLDVLVEGYGDGLSIGRSYRDAPEIDGMVLMEGKAKVGEIVPVKITGAMTYDLAGVPESSLIVL
ncbi:MAG: ribosomal protein S12 methylthiotransferase RimO [Anaerolineae bacterium CG1_02_58_13]|nr:MAG: ribosomal protein S12 methylthiotransferase RimO [Anaerolineae bacterium CG1_02_58_13]